MSEAIDPQAFIEGYGLDAPVRLGQGREMSLGKALEMEQIFCPADETSRQDPARRVAYLAGMLAAGGSLRAEDEYLLNQPE